MRGDSPCTAASGPTNARSYPQCPIQTSPLARHGGHPPSPGLPVPEQKLRAGERRTSRKRPQPTPQEPSEDFGSAALTPSAEHATPGPEPRDPGPRPPPLPWRHRGRRTHSRPGPPDGAPVTAGASRARASRLPGTRKQGRLLRPARPHSGLSDDPSPGRTRAPLRPLVPIGGLWSPRRCCTVSGNRTQRAGHPAGDRGAWAGKATKRQGLALSLDK